MKAFAYYGGKFSHLGFILPLLPSCSHFVDVFGGSGSVLMNRDPSPIETYNDIDQRVVNFFRVLRQNPQELINALELTPYSRLEHELAKTHSKDELEEARRFFVLISQSRNAIANSSANWTSTRTTTRRGMSKNVSAWLSSIDGLEEVVERFRSVQIENERAIPLIRKYDDKDTLFYCDPPYVHTSRVSVDNYKFEMVLEEHIELAEVLNNTSAKVALSGYDDPFYDMYYSDWYKTIATEKGIGSSKTLATRQEVLWTNYEPSEQIRLFET